jgi:hypothetical protein
VTPSVSARTVSPAAVYGPTLSLITCGGDFDPQTGHYDDNLIVYLDESTPSA